ncbi:hypothetical protein AAG570_007285 [Ranatra chinensis]|uniref:EGF-like domain-containing protein n=1 Tax=Ranatra chinensis TaxID=642074 RepID=A0ABD0XVF8_9HEMI
MRGNISRSRDSHHGGAPDQATSIHYIDSRGTDIDSGRGNRLCSNVRKEGGPVMSPSTVGLVLLLFVGVYAAINECELMKPCDHICHDLLDGYECSCKEGYRIESKEGHGNGSSVPHRCVDIDECWDDAEGSDRGPVYPCSQRCINTQGSYRCECIQGYELHHGGKLCEPNWGDTSYTIYPSKDRIRATSPGTRTRDIIKNLTNAVAFDFDLKGECFYWSDVAASGSSIERVCFNSSARTYQTLHSTALKNPNDLAVDWVGRNLYWCDKTLATIEVSKLDGRYRKVLVHKGLAEPRAIVLHPGKGSVEVDTLQSTMYMYWVDGGEHPHIGRAGMDGTDRRVIATSEQPYGLTIDFPADKILWVDTKDRTIYVANLDGTNKRDLVGIGKNSLLGSLIDVSAIDIIGDEIYLAEPGTISGCSKIRAGSCATIDWTRNRPTDIRAYHPSKQTQMENNPCEDNGGCAALCLLRPGGHTCACPQDLTPSQVDPQQCTAN